MGVEVASHLPPSECRQALKVLQKSATTLKLTSYLTVGLDAFAPMMHLVSDVVHVAGDIYNIYTFTRTQYFVSAILMGLLTCLIFVLQCRAVNGGILGLPREVKLS